MRTNEFEPNIYGQSHEEGLKKEISENISPQLQNIEKLQEVSESEEALPTEEKIETEIDNTFEQLKIAELENDAIELKREIGIDLENKSPEQIGKELEEQDESSFTKTMRGKVGKALRLLALTVALSPVGQKILAAESDEATAMLNAYISKKATKEKLHKTEGHELTPEEIKNVAKVYFKVLDILEKGINLIDPQEKTEHFSQLSPTISNFVKERIIALGEQICSNKEEMNLLAKYMTSSVLSVKSEEKYSKIKDAYTPITKFFYEVNYKVHTKELLPELKQIKEEVESQAKKENLNNAQKEALYQQKFQQLRLKIKQERKDAIEEEKEKTISPVTKLMRNIENKYSEEVATIIEDNLLRELKKFPEIEIKKIDFELQETNTINIGDKKISLPNPFFQPKFEVTVKFGNKEYSFITKETSRNKAIAIRSATRAVIAKMIDIVIKNKDKDEDQTKTFQKKTKKAKRETVTKKREHKAQQEKIELQETAIGYGKNKQTASDAALDQALTEILRKIKNKSEGKVSGRISNYRILNRQFEKQGEQWKATVTIEASVIQEK